MTRTVLWAATQGLPADARMSHGVPVVLRVPVLPSFGIVFPPELLDVPEVAPLPLEVEPAVPELELLELLPDPNDPQAATVAPPASDAKRNASRGRVIFIGASPVVRSLDTARWS